MRFPTWLTVPIAGLCALFCAAAAPAQAQLPKPVLYLKSMERYATGAGKFIRFNYDVTNKSSYPATLFTPAPTLPPCGSNANSSRTWVDFFDQGGKRLYGFCALTSPNGLGSLWFALPEGTAPPYRVYIEINDRQTGTKVKSNLEVTVLTPQPVAPLRGRPID